MLVIGSFNGWDLEKALKLQPVRRQGSQKFSAGPTTFKGSLRLGPGLHHLAFFVDGVRHCTSEWPLAEWGPGETPVLMPRRGVDDEALCPCMAFSSSYQILHV